MAFGGVEIILVEAGTEIEHGGEVLVVEDDQMVHKQGKVYVTQKIYDKLKEKATSRPN